MHRSPLAALALAALTAAALPATAQEAPPELRSERAFLDCPSPLRVANASTLVDGPVTWSTTAPGQRLVGSGDGCVHADLTYRDETADDTVQALVMQGTFTGRLGSFNVRLFGTSVSSSDRWALRVGVTVDGVEVVPWATPVSVRPKASNSGVTETVELGIVDLGLVADEDDVEHEITVTVSLDGSDRAGAIAWGASEVPSGLTFNPLLPAVATLAPVSG